MWYESNSMCRKTHQRKVNKVFRDMNKNIENDTLWNGRFTIKQIDSQWFVFPDSSGAYLCVYYEILDKKTRQAKLCYARESISFPYDIWKSVNDFIVNDTEVWKDDTVMTDVTDWSKINVPAWSIKRWCKEPNAFHTIVHR